jgi:hypothetical protein
MADIAPPHIESISDPAAGSPEQNAPRPRSKAAAVGKSSPFYPPEISPPEDTEIHELDEMA